MEPLPVTVLGGFLGAGKTTLLNHLIRSAEGARVGVLVNDFGVINIDARLIVGVEGDTIRLSNGCICCTIKSDLSKAVIAMAERADRPERIIVEASGISDPGTLAETFLTLERAGVARLDANVAVVDAESFTTLEGKDALLARCQLMAADLVVVNKADLAGEQRLERLEAEIRARVPTARIVRAVQGEVPLALVFGNDRTGAPRTPAQAAQGHHFVTASFTSTRPIAFAKLGPLLADLPSDVYRAKGILDLVERPGQRVVVHVVGRRIHARTLGPWGGEPPRSELVLIGSDQTRDLEALARRFGECTAEAAGPAASTTDAWEVHVTRGADLR